MTAIKLQLPVALPTAVGIRVFGCASPDGRITFGFTIVGLLLMITDHEYAITHICICTKTLHFSLVWWEFSSILHILNIDYISVFLNFISARALQRKFGNLFLSIWSHAIFEDRSKTQRNNLMLSVSCSLHCCINKHSSLSQIYLILAIPF